MKLFLHIISEIRALSDKIHEWKSSLIEQHNAILEEVEQYDNHEDMTENEQVELERKLKRHQEDILATWDRFVQEYIDIMQEKYTNWNAGLTKNGDRKT